MSARTAKICLIGDFGVGKTSLVARFVQQQFSDTYLTTVGVKIDTKPVALPGGETIKLIIWDVAGSDVVTAAYAAYVRGAAGYLLVADGTRAPTLDAAIGMQQQLEGQLGDVPWLGLLNKADLVDEWEVDHPEGAPGRWHRTSALTGDNVEQAFADLAAAIADR